MSSGHQRIKWHRHIAENFNRLNRVHERYRQTTDGRRHIANMNMSSRSLKPGRKSLKNLPQEWYWWWHRWWIVSMDILTAYVCQWEYYLDPEFGSGLWIRIISKIQQVREYICEKNSWISDHSLRRYKPNCRKCSILQCWRSRSGWLKKFN